MGEENKVKEFFGDFRQHLMTGVSFMLPVIIIYALFMVIGQLAGGPFGEFSQFLSGSAYKLIAPILGAYIAYSISGKLALAPSFIVGLMADQLGMGFLGGLIVGIATGYFVKLIVLLMSKVKGGQSLDVITSFIIVPFLGTLIMGLVVNFVIAVPISSFTEMLSQWLKAMSGVSVVLLSVILAAMIAFDMGGPINKVAYSFLILASSEGAYHVVGPALIAITVPVLALGLSTIVSKKKYDEDELMAGKSALVMSLFGLTEGAIPFAASDPLRVIPSIMAGSIVGAVCGALFGVANVSVIPSILGIFLGMVGSFSVGSILLFLLAHFIGAAVTIFLLHVWKKDAAVEE